VSPESDSLGDADGLASDGRLRAVVRALAAAVLIAGVGIAVGVLLVLAAVVTLGRVGVGVTPLLSIVLSLILATGVGFGGVALGYLRYRDRGLSYVGVRVPSLREVALVIVGYVASMGFLVVASGCSRRSARRPRPTPPRRSGWRTPRSCYFWCRRRSS